MFHVGNASFANARTLSLFSVLCFHHCELSVKGVESELSVKNAEKETTVSNSNEETSHFIIKNAPSLQSLSITHVNDEYEEVHLASAFSQLY